MGPRLVRWLRYALPIALACAYPVLSAWLNNQAEVAAHLVIRPLLLAFCLGLLLCLLLWPFARRNGARLSNSVTLVLLILFSFDLIINSLTPALRMGLAYLSISASAGYDYTIALALTGVFVLLVLFLGLSPRPQQHTKRLLTSLTIFTAAQLSFCLPALWPHSSSSAAQEPLPLLKSTKNVAPVSQQSNLPDLYCIVLDAYGRQDVLKTLFGVDNEPFLRALEKRGFFVARHSRANYLQTPLALAAALNLDYLSVVLPQGQMQEDASQILDKNRIAALLRTQGFHFISVPTGVAQTAISSADLTLDQFDGVVATLTPLDRLVISKTGLACLLNNENAAFDEHRSRLLGALEKNLPAAAALPYPKFVFAHILAPHPPVCLWTRRRAAYPCPNLLHDRGCNRLWQARQPRALSHKLCKPAHVSQ